MVCLPKSISFSPNGNLQGGGEPESPPLPPCIQSVTCGHDRLRGGGPMSHLKAPSYLIIIAVCFLFRGPLITSPEEKSENRNVGSGICPHTTKTWLQTIYVFVFSGATVNMSYTHIARVCMLCCIEIRRSWTILEIAQCVFYLMREHIHQISVFPVTDWRSRSFGEYFIRGEAPLWVGGREVEWGEREADRPSTASLSAPAWSFMNGAVSNPS